MKTKYFLWILTAWVVGAVPSLALGDYEDGTVAFERGDYETALKEFKVLTEQKDPRGQYALGLMYDLGTGVPMDFREAVKWYRLAAEQGHADAQNNLATLYEEGEGVEKDSEKAGKWYELAAQQGNFDAPNNLGTMHLQGIGVIRNYVTAHMWFHLGEMKGDRAAKNNRKFVETRMTAEEIAQAKRLVTEWMQQFPQHSHK